ncbi:hypothetical protein NC652_016889 [Populus alba x Populus x berolinensis]|nr:hypothetical protein NC652_016889 [Populus alba x Populus x berolinensis]
MAPNLVKGDFRPEEISSVWVQQDVLSTVDLLNQHYTFSSTVIAPGIFGLE